jgi:hypothetical protein
MRRTTRRAIAFVAAILVVPAVACVIADPPAQIPVPPLTQPWILSANVTPATNSILETWPRAFVVPVYVDDPGATIEWRAFPDYDPFGTISFTQGNVGPASADDAGIRNIEARLSPPVDPNACHTLEILVALGFTEDHTPASPGGDSITWFYSPTGSLADCPVYDAGPVPDASDSGDDASDGAGG